MVFFPILGVFTFLSCSLQVHRLFGDFVHSVLMGELEQMHSTEAPAPTTTADRRAQLQKGKSANNLTSKTTTIFGFESKCQIVKITLFV
jgi:hypothetical protein